MKRPETRKPMGAKMPTKKKRQGFLSRLRGWARRVRKPAVEEETSGTGRADGTGRFSSGRVRPKEREA